MKWILAESRNLRFFSFAVFYFSQGIPIGLISIALPAWLVEQGVSAGEIATLAAISMLPFGFKLIVGPVMDRFSFLPMGRRRPWVIGAQFGMVIAMLSMSLVPDPANNLMMLTWLAFFVNTCTAMQDVAVDGMAIDVLPTQERGRANAFMAFGQVSGYALIGAISASMLIAFGLAGTSLLLAIVTGTIFLLAVRVRERTGERLLPFSAGETSPRSLELQAADWRSIFVNLIKVMFLPASLLLIAVIFCWRVADGFWLVAAPVIAVQDLGFASTTYAQWTAIASLTAAGIGLLFGPLVDRHGAERILLVGFCGSGLVYFLTAAGGSLWTTAWFPALILFAHAFFNQVVFISFIATSMGLCWTKVSATQFAIYMAWANLARSIGAGIYGEAEPILTATQEFMVMGGVSLIAAALLLKLSLARHTASITALDEGDAEPLLR